MQPAVSAGMAKSRMADPQSGAAHDWGRTCEEVRAKMASQAKTLGPASTNIKDAPRTQAQLGWSNFAIVVAPNRAWQVEVYPALTSDENLTPVILRGCRKPGSWPLFTLQRDAQIYWGPESKNLLVVNEPLSGGNQLLFFEIKAVSEGKQIQAADTLDDRVKQVVLQRLGQKAVTGFYLPTFVSWRANKLLLAAGGTAFYGKPNERGPIKEYCYGLMIDTNTVQIREVLPATELRAKFGAECQAIP